MTHIAVVLRNILVECFGVFSYLLIWRRLFLRSDLAFAFPMALVLESAVTVIE